MSAEFPDHSEIQHQSSKPNGGNDDKAGYPPAGQQEQLAKIKAAEAADNTNPEAILAELEAQETEAVRAERLKAYVAEHFPDCPPELHNQASKACESYENDSRDLYGEPGFKVSGEDVSELQPEISRISVIARNNTKITEKTNEVAVAEETTDIQETQKSANAGEIKEAKSENTDLTQTLNQREDKLEEVTEDLATLEQVQARFEQLKAQKGGTIPALQSLLEEGLIKSPEIKAKVQSTIATASTLINSIPGKSAVITQMINQSNINLTAQSPVQVFAGFLAEADKSNDLSEEEKETIRRVIGQSEKDFQTGSDAQKIAASKEQIIDPKTGEVIGEKYVHDSPDNMAELRPNLGTYMDGERMMLATKDGSITRDVTGWSGEDIGLLAEALDLHNFAESYGITGMVESIGNIHMDVVHDAAFDRAKIIEVRQVVSALVGMGEGYDGDVFDPREKGILLRNQMRVLTDSDEAIEWNNDEAATTQIIEDMGLKTGGKPNYEVIKAFGAYTQENMSATRQTTQAHLHGLFPDLVKAPNVA